MTTMQRNGLVLQKKIDRHSTTVSSEKRGDRDEGRGDQKQMNILN